MVILLLSSSVTLESSCKLDLLPGLFFFFSRIEPEYASYLRFQLRSQAALEIAGRYSCHEKRFLKDPFPLPGQHGMGQLFYNDFHDGILCIYLVNAPKRHLSRESQEPVVMSYETEAGD